MNLYLRDAGVSPGEVVLKAHDAMRRISDDRGVDRRYGRLMFGQFRSLGLCARLRACAHDEGDGAGR